MPAVDGKQAAARDGDGSWYAEVGERVGGDVGDGRVGGELEHHDDILLHLILKHQGALGKETLVRQTEKERRRREEEEWWVGGWGGKRGTSGEGEVEMEVEVGRVEETEQMGQREERTKGERYISGRTGSKQVHTLRGEGLSTEGKGGAGSPLRGGVGRALH